MRISELKKAGGFWYLGSPYSLHPDGIGEAHIEACRAAGDLIKKGISVYCPIAHTHPIALIGGIDPLDHEIWMAADKPMMDAAVGLIVVKMKSWEDSYGIGEEIKAFEAAGKPVFFMEWPNVKT